MLPTAQELEQAWVEVCDIHKQYLHQHGVRLPGRGTYQWVWLAMLWIRRDSHQGVHKDAISDAVRMLYPNAGRDQQVRHLKRSGWSLTGDGGWHKLDPYHPSPEWASEQARHRGRLNAQTFSDLKATYGSKCLTCGAYEGRPDVRYTGDLIELQQGHRDPEKPADDIDNIIPQCQFCNRAYRDDFTFDEKGRVHSIASIGPVARASERVKQAVREYLGRERDGQR